MGSGLSQECRMSRSDPPVRFRLTAPSPGKQKSFTTLTRRQGRASRRLAGQLASTSCPELGARTGVDAAEPDLAPSRQNAVTTGSVAGMRLVAARLRHYRRFEEVSTLDLTPRVIAVVGPNEAGKSTLLDALENVTDPSTSRPFSAAEFTGRQPPSGDTVVLSALFAPEVEDRVALAQIPGGEQVRLWHVWRDAHGDAEAEVIPGLVRDRALRDDAAHDLRRLGERTGGQLGAVLDAELPPPKPPDGEEIDLVEQQPSTLRADIERALPELNAPAETLGESTRSLLSEIAELLEGLPESAPRYARGLPARLRQLVAEHEVERPNRRAFNLLDACCPRVHVLRDADRQLASSYAFGDHETPPAPLENLLSLASLDWDELRKAAAITSNPRLATLLERANRQLEERLHGSWKQATVSIRLTEQSGMLNIYPYDADSDEHSVIEDRSDGFRSFLALLAFTTRHSEGKRKLILGIDEAELHLHYNAQADLVKVLTEQNFATQIIYTTHSAGCLPEDLGSAIRAVRSVPGDRSVIDNGFWSAAEGPGLTSLMMAMGAGAMAFTPARRAVIAEGPSDALLLPALFRQAAGINVDESLKLQVAGGLAWTPPRLYSRLETEAGQVVYLVDSDAEGDRYRDDLKDAGVEQDRIFVLADSGGQALTMEDFVDKQTYAEVFSYLMEQHRGYEGEPLIGSQLPDVGAVAAAESWAAGTGLAPPSKTAVAEHLLCVSRASLAYIFWDPGAGEPAPLLRAERAVLLATLLESIRERLGITAEELEN